MHAKMISIILLSLILFACGKPDELKVNYKTKLAQALYLKDFKSVAQLKHLVRLSENSQNLINTYQIMQQSSEPELQVQLNYLQQFYQQMNESHQSFYNQMHKWLLFMQIYRTEISPPVRILQREELYLAPSNIDFNTCLKPGASCANIQRSKLVQMITEQNITEQLKRMALKDPCVNLSKSLKGSAFANRCLETSKGNAVIELLPKPFLTRSKWMEVIVNE